MARSSILLLSAVALALAAGAVAFAPSGAFTLKPSLRASASSRARPSSVAVRMQDDGIEKISAEEYEALLIAAGRKPAPKKAAAPPANPFAGLFGGGAKPQAAVFEDDSDVAPPPPQPKAVAPPAPKAAAPKKAAAPANPFGGLFGGFGGGTVQEVDDSEAEAAAAAAAAAAQAQAAAAAQAAEQARLAAEAQAAAAARAQAPPALPNPFAGFGGFSLPNPFDNAGAKPTAKAPEPAAADDMATVTEKELRELMVQAQKDSVSGYSLSGGKSFKAEDYVPPPKVEAKKPQQVDGVKVTQIRAGDRRTYPVAGDRLVMHYVGKLRSTKQKFDSSVERGAPFEFTIGVGEVIPGWDVGVMQMSLGEKAQLVISSDYAYGAAGQGPIPPNSDLVFDVDLLSINGVKARRRD